MNAKGQADQLNQYFGPGVLGGNIQQIYQMLLASPAFQNMLNQYGLQGSQLSQNLTAGLAQRGLTGTGVGTVAQNLGNAVPGFMQTQARGDLYGQAFQAALQNLMGRMGSFTSLEEQRRSKPGFLQSALGGLFGAAGMAGGLGWNPFGHKAQTQPYLGPQ